MVVSVVRGSLLIIVFALVASISKSLRMRIYYINYICVLYIYIYIYIYYIILYVLCIYNILYGICVYIIHTIVII